MVHAMRDCAFNLGRGWLLGVCLAALGYPAQAQPLSPDEQLQAIRQSLVQLALDGSKVTVELAAEVEATRVALEQALPSLAGALHEAGFTLAGGWPVWQRPETRDMKARTSSPSCSRKITRSL